MPNYTFTDDAKALLKQIDHAYDHQPEKLPGLAYQAIIELMKVVKENDELAAHVERLRQSGNRVVLYKDPESDWLQAVSETPPQSLAAVRAEAVGERP